MKCQERCTLNEALWRLDEPISVDCGGGEKGLKWGGLTKVF